MSHLHFEAIVSFPRFGTTVAPAQLIEDHMPRASPAAQNAQRPHWPIVQGRQPFRWRGTRRATKAEEVLRGEVASEETFRAAAEAELADASPLPGNAFKVPLARNVIVSTLLDLAGAGLERSGREAGP